MTGRPDGRQPRVDESVEGGYGECDGESVFVISDPTTENAWIAVPAGEEVPLEERR